MQVPLDSRIKTVDTLPYTLTYVIRKRLQLDNFNELPKEKRPPNKLIWDGTSDEIDEWLDKVLGRNENPNAGVVILEDEIEK